MRPFHAFERRPPVRARRSYPGVGQVEPGANAAQEIVVPLLLREGDHELAFISTISTFGTAIDITLAELSIEAFYPANAPTAMRLVRDVGQS